jgi:lipopolysaccharide biosynthesis glycosyltransferase
MKSDVIPIVFAANNYYVPYMATTMQSIMENSNKAKRYIFYILHQEINDENINLLKNQIIPFLQFSIEFINVKEYIEKYSLFVSRHVTVETYFRFIIPELLYEYQKVIYLDGDMVCCVDISILIDINLNNFLLAAVQDGAIAWYHSKKDIKGFYKYHKALVSLKNPENYFNAGLLIINIELFRKTITTDQLFELAASKKWQIHDQDVLNYLVEGKTLFLPLHWNFMYNKYANYFPDHLKQEYDQAEKNPMIVHYIHFKPWNQYVFFPQFELFWKYATRTPFIDTVIENMKSNDFISEKPFKNRIISNITHKRGIGIRFILYDCLKAWLLRNKSK